MSTFDEDVVITDHDLVLLGPDGTEIARFGRVGAAVRLGPLLEAPLPGTGKPGQAGADFLLHDREGRSILLASAQASGATLDVGSSGRAGHVHVLDDAGREAVHADAARASVRVGTEGAAGRVSTMDVTGRETVLMAGDEAEIHVGAFGATGGMVVHDSSGRDVVTIDGAIPRIAVGAEHVAGELTLAGRGGRDVISLDGSAAVVSVGADGEPGGLSLHDVSGAETVRVDGGAASVVVGANGRDGLLQLRDAEGRDVFHMRGPGATLSIGAGGNPGDIVVRDDAGADRIHISGAEGDIILTGADLAEDFGAATTLAPGTVVVASGVDEVMPATEPLDRRVVGVASGAGSFKPALRLGSRPGGRRVPVAIAGRAYCRADARHGAISIGDLLCTSPTPGHAMRVPDASAASGAILGKALEPLAAGAGLVPVLLTLC